MSAGIGRSLVRGFAGALGFCAGVTLCVALVAFTASKLLLEDGGWCETVLYGADVLNAPKVVRVALNGDIGGPALENSLGGIVDRLLGTEGGSKAGSSGISAREQVREAARDPSVKGLYLEIDSPGGDLTECDVLWHDTVMFRRSRKGRFVFVHARGQCCSGGYYVAMAANEIMVLPTGEVGSIGVMTDYGCNISALAANFGVTNVVVASGANKDVLNPLSPVSKEQLEIENSLIRHQHERFMKIVSEARGIDPDALRPLADGRVFQANDALKHGLVDSIGYEEDAVARVKELAGGDAVVVAYEESPVPPLRRLLRFCRRGLSARRVK